MATTPFRPRYLPRNMAGASGLPGSSPSPWSTIAQPKPAGTAPSTGLGGYTPRATQPTPELSTGLGKYKPRGSNPTVPNQRPTPDPAGLGRTAGFSQPFSGFGGFSPTPSTGGPQQPAVPVTRPMEISPSALPSASGHQLPGPQTMEISPAAYGGGWQSLAPQAGVAPANMEISPNAYTPRGQVVEPQPAATPTTPATPVDRVGPQTEQGKIYDQRVLDALAGNSPEVRVARERQDRDSARRIYGARRAAEEQAAQAGYQPGTAQYVRTVDMLMRQANEANLAGEQGVGDLSRQVMKDTMGQALGVEERTYGRGITERIYGDTQESKKHGRENEIINSVEDPKFKYYLRSVQASGGNVEAAYQAGLDNGTIKPEFRSQSPVQDIKTEAEEWIKITRPDLAPGSPEYQAEVTKRMQAIYDTKNQPLNAAGKARELESSVDAAFQSVLDGKADISSLKDSDWQNATPAQLRALEQSGKVGTLPSIAPFRMDDWVKTGLKADKVYEKVGDTEYPHNDKSAGQGKGSVVMVGGQPYRISRYETDKNTTNVNERRGRIYAINLKTGKEEVLMDTGWKEI